MTSSKGLHIQMFSIHGLIRAESMQLGYDADTGGQIKYVVELCKSLLENDNIAQIDLFTRLINDKSFSEDYSQPIEKVNDKFNIIRIQCGGKKYIRKELLWPHLDEFIDKTIKYIRQNKKIPDVFHGHYPDAGYVVKELAGFFGIPMVYTGHSLGRSKKARLLEQGGDLKEMNRRLKIDHRIKTEEQVLKSADLVITSTSQEIQGQYLAYKNRTIPEYAVVPPGIEIDKFFPYYQDDFSNSNDKEEALFAKASVTEELNRFFQHPDRPMIFALCRPDKKKNIEGLVKAYGEDAQLQAMANLAIFAGIRKDISAKQDNERKVLTRMLLLMDKYNLYGKMAIPKKHDFEHEVPELYRIAAESKGVFVNPALTEPFGLTLLEASACGCPIVATSDGGPKEIMSNCESGILVDPTDPKAIAKAIKKIITDSEQWSGFSKNGILNTRKKYTWKSHADTYTEKISQLCCKYGKSSVTLRTPKAMIGKRLTKLDYFLITDIDNTLLGGNKKQIDTLMSTLEKNRDKVGFGIATGRTLESATKILDQNNIISPDILITCVGARISYGTQCVEDKGWVTHISKQWSPDLIKLRLKEIDFITLQEDEVQQPYKISYYMKPGKDRLAKIHHVLTRNRFRYTLIYSHDKYLDILPYRASKGKAVRYLCYKWGIPLQNIIISGDSGNDAQMLKGEPLGIVVGNYSKELEALKKTKHIYFAKKTYAAGIIEGLEHYRFFQNT